MKLLSCKFLVLVASGIRVLAFAPYGYNRHTAASRPNIELNYVDDSNNAMENPVASLMNKDELNRLDASSLTEESIEEKKLLMLSRLIERLASYLVTRLSAAGVMTTEYIPPSNLDIFSALHRAVGCLPWDRVQSNGTPITVGAEREDTWFENTLERARESARLIAEELIMAVDRKHTQYHTQMEDLRDRFKMAFLDRAKTVDCETKIDEASTVPYFAVRVVPSQKIEEAGGNVHKKKTAEADKPVHMSFLNKKVERKESFEKIREERKNTLRKTSDISSTRENKPTYMSFLNKNVELKDSFEKMRQETENITNLAQQVATDALCTFSGLSASKVLSACNAAREYAAAQLENVLIEAIVTSSERKSKDAVSTQNCDDENDPLDISSVLMEAQNALEQAEMACQTKIPAQQSSQKHFELEERETRQVGNLDLSEIDEVLMEAQAALQSAEAVYK